MRIERGYLDSGVDMALEVLAGDARLLVLGPVGSGRTTLLADIAAREQERRRVWPCRGHRVGGPSGEPALWEGSVESLLDAAGRAPTTLLVDDVDLLDACALQRVLLLAERRDQLDLRIVAAHRPARPIPELAALDHALIGPRGALHLGPLTEEGVSEWAGERGDVLHERTGGWPDLVAADLAGSIADLVGARMALLADDHRRGLREICFGLPPAGDDRADEALDAARTVGLIHDGFTPQPAVAEAVRAASPSADRAHIAALAASAPLDVAATVAGHLQAVGDRSTEARALCEIAADELHRRQGAAWAHVGRPDLAAVSYLDGDAAPCLAVLPLVATGRLVDASAARESASPRPSEPSAPLADGALAWAAGDADSALALFALSARMAEMMGDVQLWPDSPHALAALSATHWLESERAESVMRTARDRGVGGAAFTVRHRLLAAWAALRAGRVDAAVELLADVPAATAERDAMVAGVLQAALALRADDPEVMPATYRAALDRYAACLPDPFVPGLAVELAHLAARIGADPVRVLAPLDSLARQLGDPPTIAVHLAWARLLVAVATDDPPGARAAAVELDALAATSRLAQDATAGEPTRLLADAAAAFADVLDGKVAADSVRALASRLVDRGLVFEASRLVGAASIRSSDPAAARSLLADLRRLRTTQVVRGVTGTRAIAELTDRERDVARGVLDGRTHREIGAQLFISAKTVEHHVARIRQKLGAGSKAELLAAIREELAVDRVQQTLEGAHDGA